MGPGGDSDICFPHPEERIMKVPEPRGRKQQESQVLGVAKWRAASPKAAYCPPRAQTWTKAREQLVSRALEPLPGSFTMNPVSSGSPRRALASDPRFQGSSEQAGAWG